MTGEVREIEFNDIKTIRYNRRRQKISTNSNKAKDSVFAEFGLDYEQQSQFQHVGIFSKLCKWKKMKLTLLLKINFQFYCS